MHQDVKAHCHLILHMVMNYEIFLNEDKFALGQTIFRLILHQ